jgi:hypothetical protein
MRRFELGERVGGSNLSRSHATSVHVAVGRSQLRSRCCREDFLLTRQSNEVAKVPAHFEPAEPVMMPHLI